MMDILAWANLIAYSVVAIIGALGNLTFLITLCVSKTIRHTLGTSTILLGALAINDFVMNAVVLPLRIWNMAVGGRVDYVFYDNSALCIISSRAFYAFTQVSAWLLCALAGCRTCAVYAPHFYRYKFRRVAVQLALAITALFLGWCVTVISVADSWVANIPLSYTGGTCEAVPVSYTSARDQFMYALYVTIEFWKGFWIPMPLGFVFYGLTCIRLLWHQHVRVAAAVAQKAHENANRTVGNGPSQPVLSVQDGSVGNTRTGALTRFSAAGPHDDSDQTYPKTVAISGVPIPGESANPSPRTDQPKTNTLAKSSTRTLMKLRLLAVNHIINAVLVLPGGIAYATQAYMTEWGASVPWLWAALNIFNLCALAANPIVFAVTSEDVRKEYKRIFLPAKWT